MSDPPEAGAGLVRLAWLNPQGAECVPIRSESRCLCGHRLKDHGDHTQGWRCADRLHSRNLHRRGKLTLPNCHPLG